MIYSLSLVLIWISYYIVYMILMFRMAQFFQDELNITLKKQLASLWLTCFILQIMALSITFLYVIFSSSLKYA